jgi:hypothetical protein
MIQLAEKRSPHDSLDLRCVGDFPPVFQRGHVLIKMLHDPDMGQWAGAVGRDDGEVPTEEDRKQALADFTFITMPVATRELQ